MNGAYAPNWLLNIKILTREYYSDGMLRYRGPAHDSDGLVSTSMVCCRPALTETMVAKERHFLRPEIASYNSAYLRF